MSNYDQYLQRARRQHGKRFTDGSLALQFRAHLHSGRRIKVRREYPSGGAYVRTGTVGVTTGWAPAFLLMHRRSDHGSSDVLSERDDIIAVQGPRGNYVPV